MTYTIREPDLYDDIRDLSRRVATLERIPSGVPHGSISGGVDSTGAVQPSHIITGSIISDYLYSGTVEGYLIKGQHIAAGSIKAVHIEAGTITTGMIVADTAEINKLQAAHIAAGAITANHVQAVTLSAGSVLIGGTVSGVIQAGAIVAGTIAASAFEGNAFSLKNGGFFHTGDSGTARLVMGTSIPTSTGNKSGLIMVDSTNAVTLWADPVTGNVELKGVIKAGSTGLGNFGDQINSGQIPNGAVNDTHITGVTSSKLIGIVPPVNIPPIGGGNLLLNSSFENGTANWVVTGPAGTHSTTEFSRHGSKSVKSIDGTTLFYQDVSGLVSGKKYVASAWIRKTTGSTLRTRLHIHDTTTANPSSITADSTFANGVWDRLTTTFTATSTGAARIHLYADGFGAPQTGTVYFDSIQFEEGEVATGYAPKPYEIMPGAVTNEQIADLAATKLTGKVPAVSIPQIGGGNLVKNSSFALGAGASATGSWTVQGGAWSYLTGITDAFFGTTVAEAQTLSATNALDYRLNGVYVPVKPGLNYTMSAYFRSVGGNGGSGRLRLFYRDASNPISTAEFTSPTLALTTSWQRLTFTALAPSNAVYVRPLVDGITNASNKIQVNAVQIEVGEVPTAYAPQPEEILPNTITATEIADNAITSPKIIANAVVAGKIAANAVTANEIAANTITAAKIAADTITANEIAANAITASELSANSVIAGKVAAGAITTEKLTVASVANSAIMNGGFEEASEADATLPARWRRNLVFGGDVTTAIISSSASRSGTNGVILKPTGNSGSVYADAVPVNEGEVWYISCWARSVSGTTRFYLRARGGSTYNSTATEMVAGVENIAVPTTWTKYTGQIVIPAGIKWACAFVLNYANTSEMYVDDVEFSKVTVSAQIQDGAITTSKMVANSISGDRITAGTLDATKIVADSITADQIAANAITVSELAANAVTAAKIEANAVIAGKISSVAFEGYTFSLKNGGYFYTGDSGTARLVMGTSIPTSVGTKSGLIMVDATNAITLHADPATGNIELKGIIKSGSTGLGNFSDQIVGAQVPYNLIGAKNAFLNSSFESPSGTPWTNYTGFTANPTVTTVQKRTGANSISGTLASAGVAPGWTTDFSPVAGESYVASIFVYMATARTCWMIARNASANYNVTGPSIVVPANTWTRIHANFTASGTGALILRINSATAFASGEVLYFDDAQVETGSVLTAYAPKTGEILPDSIGASELLDLSTSLSGNVTTGSTLLLVGGVSAGTIGVGSLAAGTIAAKGITAAQIAAGSITAAEINVLPGGNNLLPNSGFENTSVISWSMGGTPAPVIQTAVFKSGTRAVAVQQGGVANMDISGLVPGQKYVFSTWYRNAATTDTIRAMIRVHDTTGTNYSPLVAAADASTEWRRFSTVYTANSTGAARVHLWTNSPSGSTGTLYYDEAIFQEGDVPTGYSPKADEILPDSILSTHIGPGEIRTGNIAANSIQASHVATKQIQASHIAFSVGGQNYMPDSSFESYTIGGATPPSTWVNSGGVGGATARQGSTYNSIVVNGTQPGNGKYLEVKYGSGSTPYIYYRFTGAALAPFLGRKVTASAYVYRPGNSPVPASTHPFILIGDNSTSAQVNAGDITHAAGTWFRVAATTTIALAATYVEMRLYSPFSDTTNGIYLFDALQVEIGDVATEWIQYINPTVIDGSSISAATITGTTITGGTITGSTVRTAASGARVEMDSTGLYAKDVSNNNNVSLTGANGLDILTGFSSSVERPRAVSWVTSGGVLAGDITVYPNSDGASSTMYFRVRPVSATTGGSFMTFQTQDSSGTNYCGMTIDTGRIQIYDGPTDITIDDAAGASQIKLNGSIERLRVSGYSGTTHKIGVSIGSGSAIYAIDALVDGSSYFQVRNNGHTYTNGGVVQNISRREIKENIRDADLSMTDIKRIRIRNFTFKEPFMKKHGTQIGVVVEELASVLPMLVMNDDDGRPESVGYSLFGAVAIKGLQDVADRFNSLLEALALIDNPQLRSRLATLRF